MEFIDSLLISVFLVFAFTALVFEPLYYFGCNWEFSQCSLSPFEIVRVVGDIWNIYNRYDPLFANIPDWLRIMCAIEVVLFGPLYALAAYGLYHRARWLPSVVYPFAGALIYSTIVYFMMEFLYTTPGTNLFMVLIINVPWTIFPAILAYRVAHLSRQRTKVQ